MENMAQKRVDKRQNHKTYLSAVFHLEITLRVPHFPYNMSLGNASTCIENFLQVTFSAIIELLFLYNT